MAQQYTRKMIREQFVALLEEKPLDEITVKDVVERCQINRKTFYYYYQDLYAVLSEIFQTELDKVTAADGAPRPWEDSFLEAAEFALSHKKTIEHVYHSMRRDELDGYLYTVAGNVMNRYVERMGEGLHAYEEDKRVIACFYQSALTEMVLRWIIGGMREDPPTAIRRVGRLFDGNIALSLKRSETLPPAAWDPKL